MVIEVLKNFDFVYDGKRCDGDELAHLKREHMPDLGSWLPSDAPDLKTKHELYLCENFFEAASQLQVRTLFQKAAWHSRMDDICHWDTYTHQWDEENSVYHPLPSKARYSRVTPSAFDRVVPQPFFDPNHPDPIMVRHPPPPMGSKLVMNHVNPTSPILIPRFWVMVTGQIAFEDLPEKDECTERYIDEQACRELAKREPERAIFNAMNMWYFIMDLNS